MRGSHPKPPSRPARPRARRQPLIGTKTLIIIVLIVAAVVILAAVVPLLIPTSAAKGWLEKRVSAVLDARLEMDALRFRLLPTPGYAIRRLRFVSKKFPFQGLPAVMAEEVRGQLSFFDLLAGRVVATVEAKGVDIDYRIAGGQSNIGTMVKDIRGLSPALAPNVPAFDGQPAVSPDAQAPAMESPSLPPQPLLPPSSNDAPGPVSQMLRKLGIPIASAKESERGQGSAAASSGGEGRPVIVRSVTIRQGRFRIWDNGVPVWAVEGLSCAASRFSSDAGMAADVRLVGRIPGRIQAAAVAAGGTPIDLSGQGFVDVGRREMGIRGLRALIAGSQLAADVSVNYGATPISFDLHLATPDVDPGFLTPLLDITGGHLPVGLSWQGSVALDLALKGTRGAYEINAQVDGGPARFGFGKLFVKGAGMPFRLALSGSASPRSYIVREGSAVLGRDTFSVKGELGRGDDAALHADIGGSKLDGGTLKLFFPLMGFLEAMEEADVDVVFDGGLKGEAPMAFGGTIGARRIVVAAQEIANFEGKFEREIAGLAAAAKPPVSGEPALAPTVQEALAPPPPSIPQKMRPNAIVFPSLRGEIAGGQFSGNGSVVLGDEVEIAAEAVGNHLEASQLASGALAGETSLVVKAASKGADAAALSRNLRLEGSLVVNSGSWREAKLGPELFSADLWKVLEEGAATKLDAAAEAKLAAVGDTFTGLKAAFESSEEGVSVSELSWAQDLFEAKLAGKVDGGGRIAKGEGTIWIGKGPAAQLVAQIPARKMLLETDGRLMFPVAATGRLPAMELKADTEKLLGAIKARAALPPQKTSPPKEEKKPVPAETKPKEPAAMPQVAPSPSKPAMPQKPAEMPPPKKPASLAPKAEAGAVAPEQRTPAKKGKRSSPPSDEQVDNMLKVIIGQ